MPPGPKIFLSAGEASGEHYGTLLIPALRRLDPQAEFFGLGGRRMEALGFRPIVRSEDVAVMGITEIVRHIPHIYREYQRLKASILAEKPDAAVLIDFPDVNLSLARTLKKRGVPVIYFVSPQLWAWKKYRIKKVQKYVDRMLVIFPFEERFYQDHGVEAEFVGHPLAELPRPVISREAFARQAGLDASKLWVGLLPGSRSKELRLNLPEMVRAAAMLHRESLENSRQNCEFLLPLAHTLTSPQRDHIRAVLAGLLAAESAPPRITLVDDARAVLQHAQASVVASGTATVEAGLIGNPFIVVYRLSPLSYAVAKRVVDVPHVAMVNLIAGKRIVPELIQGDFTAANVVSLLRPLLYDEEARVRMQADLSQTAEMLQGEESAIDRVARITSRMLHRNERLSPVS
ncbi:lipid-A-disaccharide synthase [Paracidobacterium acidisoli]|uniref:Lipid-A-disaccharide synthase n=1 Tax=Paracidobacterium acidisoli TaxID=2303751 RepID=A0A372IRM4_9BACT|nr:lipid-A-disaccharide synthase [Paracidobacterium acidisoli]MBT9330483.1 lipid-A-disaccharide synthase [Paracidobacterium acidisoli]